MTDGISEHRREQREEEEEQRRRGRQKQPEAGSALAGAPSLSGKRRHHAPTDLDAEYPYVRVKLLLRTGPNAATDPVVALRDDTARVLEDVFMLDAASTFRLWADDLLDAQH